MLIPLDQPFSLVHTLGCGQAFRWKPEGGWHYGVIFGNIIKIRQGLLGLEFHSHPQPEEEIAHRLGHYLRLGDDLPSIYQRIALDERMRSAVARFHGLRLLRQDPWECLISFICSINSNIPRISASIEALSRRLGERLELDDHVRHAFPTPEQVAGLGEVGLRSLGMGFRAKYLAHAARRVAEEGYDFDNLRELACDDAKRDLMGLYGVGEKVADCVLLFSLDKTEAFPVDRWVRRAVEEWYLGGKCSSIAAVRQWAMGYFGPYAGYAQQYLFHGRRLERYSALAPDPGAEA